MEYLFAKERPDYSDLASGRVLYSRAGHPAFPVRLASEIFQRCLAARARRGRRDRCCLYDPCCGTGYLLAVLGYLHRPLLRAVIGSEVDAGAADLAGKNLALLQPEGLRRRLDEIETMIAQFGKESHREAYQSGLRLLEKIQVEEGSAPLVTRAFEANALESAALRFALEGEPVDVVLTDIPYGQHSEWQGYEGSDPVAALLESVHPLLAPAGVAAVISDKHQKIAHPAFRRVEHFQVGLRKVTLLAPE